MLKSFLIASGTAVTVFCAFTSAATVPTPSAAPLRPLSERDQRAAHGSGCQLSFDNGRSTLVYVLEHEYMIRTGAGRTVCRINDAQFSRLSEGGSMSCGGYRITIRQTGRTVAHEASDSASTPATLTVSGRGRPWSVRGQWGSAC
ncbi:hypothetical protein [Allosphingosinicella sp.]|uniref:hypothetical protein n=1 Tax=Allosphingosinicella sp. TaxID=2823234 RepID=UPI003783075B